VPPLSDAAWQAEFDRYRASPQYEIMNRGMGLQAFKTIYWWEWGHRQLGRLIGLVYLAGFAWVVWRRAASAPTIALLAGMGVLLSTQGLVGWLMVASGLEPGMTAVAPIRLALHLALACLFFVSLVAVFIRTGGAVHETAGIRTRIAAWSLVLLGLAQIALGGLVAGHDAGLAFNTWPLMDGHLVPPGIGRIEAPWLNAVDNIAAVQFNHRLGGYLLAAAALAYAVALRRADAPLRRRAFLIGALVLAQIALGVVTLVQIVPTPLALAHQGLALVILFVLVWNAAVLHAAETGAGAAASAAA
jgi:cytochrome c oxidase assembly protein subunit 15